MVLHLNKLESPSPKDTLCQVWLKLAQWFSRRRSFNFVNVHVFSLFRSYLPLEKRGTLHLNKIEFPSPKDALCKVWLKLAQWFWRKRWKVVLEKRMKMWKDYDNANDNANNNNNGQPTNFDQKSKLEPLALVS